MSLLEIKQVVAGYGAAVALHGVSLSLKQGERVSLLGANGAGKSSIVNVVSGLLPVRSGEVWFQGERIDGWAAHRIVGLGVSQVPEGRLVFPKMTVWENLELGATTLKDTAQKSRILEQVFELFPRLSERRKQMAGTMSGG
ncbi:MAG: ATP-binding cassette domain-containing protein, partial [Pseudomonadota bacterium]